MARLFTDGAEALDLLFWSGMQDWDLNTVESSLPAISPYYYKLRYGDTAYKNFPTALSEVYLRYRMRIQALSTNHYILAFRKSTTNIVFFRLDGTYRIYAQATTIGVLETSSFIPTPNVWYLYQIYFKEANSPDGRLVVYVDGNKIIDYSGDTQPSTDTTFDNIWFGPDGSSTSNNFFLDDLAANDTSGDFDNSWCGDGIITKVTPSGSGTINQWLNSGSTSGSSNYEYVDEYPTDGSSTYVYCSGSNTGFQDRYALSSFDGAGKTITRIYAETRARKIYGVEGGINIGYLPNGGSPVISGSADGLPISTFGRIVSTSGSINPVTELPWTADDINALEYVCGI